MHRGLLIALVLVFTACKGNLDVELPGDDDDTTEEPTPAPDPVDPDLVVDATYFLDLRGGGFVFTEPEGLEPLITAFHPEAAGILFTVLLPEADGLVKAMLATAYVDADTGEWTQSEGETTVLHGTWFNPEMELFADELWLGNGEVDVWLSGMSFTGRFEPDASAIVDVAMSLTADLACADEVLGVDPGTLCAFGEDMSGIECDACPADAPHEGDYCLFMAAVDGTCGRIEGLVLEEIEGDPDED